MPKNPGSPLASTTPRRPASRASAGSTDPSTTRSAEAGTSTASRCRAAPTTTSAWAMASRAGVERGSPSIPITVSTLEPSLAARRPQLAAGRSVRFPERVEVAGVVQVASRTARTQRRAHQEQGVAPQLVLLADVLDLVEPAAQGELVGPAGAVGDDHRGVVRVTARAQLGDHLPGARRGQEDRHRGAVPGELPQLLL